MIKIFLNKSLQNPCKPHYDAILASFFMQKIKIKEMKTLKIQTDYFYGTEAGQYAFFKIPKLLFSAPEYKDISIGAKLLYGLMLDRMSLSVKNGWFDENGRAFIYFTISDISNQLSCGSEKANKLLFELDSEKGCGLIERKKQGQGKPTIIYLKKFTISETEKQDFGKTEVLNTENQNSGLSEIGSQDLGESKCNNNEFNNNELSNTEIISYPIVKPDATDWIEEHNTYEEIIKENIDYDVLCERFSKEWLDEIVTIMVDVVCSKESFIRINKQDIPHEAVKSRFLKLSSMHIEYIYFALNENTSQVRNIRAFLITTIYRSYETADNYYSAAVKHDMANPKF